MTKQCIENKKNLIDAVNKGHRHIELPSGAMASVSKDCKPETLVAIDEMVEAAKKGAAEIIERNQKPSVD